MQVIPRHIGKYLRPGSSVTYVVQRECICQVRFALIFRHGKGRCFPAVPVVVLINSAPKRTWPITYMAPLRLHLVSPPFTTNHDLRLTLCMLSGDAAPPCRRGYRHAQGSWRHDASNIGKLNH